jgi:hypothetical protein
MELRWTEEAADDLERISDYLFEETPTHAPELVRAIYKAPNALLSIQKTHPVEWPDLPIPDSSCDFVAAMQTPLRRPSYGQGFRPPSNASSRHFQ